VEAETAPLDAQALARRIALKARDGGVDGVILVLPGTRRAREFVRDASESLVPSFPGSGRHTLDLLAAGKRPPESAIVRI
jgi:hypothetical protein